MVQDHPFLRSTTTVVVLLGRHGSRAITVTPLHHILRFPKLNHQVLEGLEHNNRLGHPASGLVHWEVRQQLTLPEEETTEEMTELQSTILVTQRNLDIIDRLIMEKVLPPLPRIGIPAQDLEARATDEDTCGL